MLILFYSTDFPVPESDRKTDLKSILQQHQNCESNCRDSKHDVNVPRYIVASSFGDIPRRLGNFLQMVNMVVNCIMTQI